MQELTMTGVLKFLNTFELDNESRAVQGFTTGELKVFVEENNIRLFFSPSPNVTDLHLQITPSGKEGETLVFIHWREGNEVNKSLDDFIRTISVFNKVIPEITLFHLERGNACLRALETRLELEREQEMANRKRKMALGAKSILTTHKLLPLRGREYVDELCNRVMENKKGETISLSFLTRPYGMVRYEVKDSNVIIRKREQLYFLEGNSFQERNLELG